MSSKSRRVFPKVLPGLLECLKYFAKRDRGGLTHVPHTDHTSSSPRVDIQTHRVMSQVFCLYIRVKLKPEMVKEFLERWGILAAHVKANEPATLSYELCRSDQNEDEFMIVERYPSRAQLETPHQQSEWWPNLHISSRGTLSAHNAVFLTESDIISLLYMVAYCITNKSRSKVFLRYWLSSPLVARPCT